MLLFRRSRGTEMLELVGDGEAAVGPAGFRYAVWPVAHGLVSPVEFAAFQLIPRLLCFWPTWEKVVKRGCVEKDAVINAALVSYVDVDLKTDEKLAKVVAHLQELVEFLRLGTVSFGRGRQSRAQAGSGAR